MTTHDEACGDQAVVGVGHLCSIGCPERDRQDAARDAIGDRDRDTPAFRLGQASELLRMLLDARYEWARADISAQAQRFLDSEDARLRR